MKKIFQLSLMILVLLLAFDNDMYAQRGKKKKKKSTTDEYFDEGGSLKHKLWYGGGFTLGFSGDQFQTFFNIGLSPTVGYKITDKFSAGPRVSFIYNNAKVQTNNGVLAGNSLSWDAGIFARYKVLPIIFAQVEYQYENAKFFTISSSSAGQLDVTSRKRNNFLVGLGYNSAGGGLVGYEILVLYNTSLPNTVFENPFVLRFGLTYNF